MTNSNNIIGDFIRSFKADCEAKGHYFADNPFRPGWQYCEACGAVRQIAAMEKKGQDDDTDR